MVACVVRLSLEWQVQHKGVLWSTHKHTWSLISARSELHNDATGYSSVVTLLCCKVFVCMGWGWLWLKKQVVYWTRKWPQGLLDSLHSWSVQQTSWVGRIPILVLRDFCCYKMVSRILTSGFHGFNKNFHPACKFQVSPSLIPRTLLVSFQVSPSLIPRSLPSLIPRSLLASFPGHTQLSITCKERTWEWD